MTQRTFHRKPLPCPPALCSFSSAEGRKLMKTALAEGTAETSFRLLEQFTTQDEPAYCGLSTLVMVLNTLNIDPGRVWKGPWRWFHEEMLDCCEDLNRVKEHGITFDQFCCLARCNGAAVEPHRPDEPSESLELFRERLINAVSDPEGPVFVVAYSRKVFEQTGDGHYSPIGAYHKSTDAALILDVARFKLPPHWVPVPLLWKALQAKDSSTNRCRGYALLSLRSDIRGAEAPFLSIRLPLREEMLKLLRETKEALQSHFEAQNEAKEEKGPSPQVPKLAVQELRTRLSNLEMGGLLRQATPREFECCNEESQVMRDLRQQTNDLLAALGDPLDTIAHQQSPQKCNGGGYDAGYNNIARSQSLGCNNDYEAPSPWAAADVLAFPPSLWLPDELLEGNDRLKRMLDTERMQPPLGAEVRRLRSVVQDYVTSGELDDTA
eukprot:TRINITY_DN31012_c0_g1_i1.p1 TRINITY_DN31012_c0_g1~~TRINITY_DN31012_c0_g1_i1.p1  ORF type:complete len:482 (+),score=76.72 TRINITY_DN31012_c0_g1_i1:137-1447(+)